MPVEGLVKLAASLRDDTEERAQRIESEGSADCIYNPLIYAWDIHEHYINLAGSGGAKTILLGMLSLIHI